jgi:hypothetical protein
MERRLQKRYVQLVREHMNSSNRNAAGPNLLPGESQAASATQAAWRFLNNPNVELTDLVEPLRQAGREAANKSQSDYVLLAHDWCKIDYKSHTRKNDVRQVTHEAVIGYDMTSALLIDGANGAPLAPMQMHLKTADSVHSTASEVPDCDDHHLDQVEPTMREAQTWGLERKVVHVIDREADALGRMRTWDAAGHLFLVRTDDRRVLWNEESWLISEIVEHQNQQLQFAYGGKALYHGKPATQEIAQVDIVLHRPHKIYVDGKQKEVAGDPLPMRLVMTRIVDEDDSILAEWTLLTNIVDSEVSAYQVALWYYWRWLIETYFKLLKSHGQELEYWQQTTGLAIARRILVASMACVMVWSLQHDDSPEATKTKKVLIRLSGRQMKHGRLSTASALLAGYMTLLSIIDLLHETDIDIGDLERISANVLPFGDLSKLV